MCKRLVPKIVLKRSEVENYLKEKNQNEIVTVDGDVSMDGDDANKSVVFISEEKATADVKKIRELYKTIHDQSIRIRRLKLHVKGLQNIILNEKKNIKIEQIEETIVIDDDETESNEFDRAFDDD